MYEDKDCLICHKLVYDYIRVRNDRNSSEAPACMVTDIYTKQNPLIEFKDHIRITKCKGDHFRDILENIINYPHA